MPGLEIDIVPLTLTSHDDDIRACAALINRRQQFEPNRLRDVTRSEEDRLQANVRRLRTHLSDPQTSAYVARRKGTDEVLGWISWLRPEDTLNGTHKATSDQATHVNDAIDTGGESDYERDYEAVKAVANEKKVQQKRIFGDQPFWTLSYLFASPHVRRSGVGSQLVSYFLSILCETDPEARVGFTSSPMAQNLYEKQGFKPVAWFDFIFDDVDEQGKPYKHRTRWPYMSNWFEGLEKEIKLAQKRQSYNGPADLDPEMAN